MRGTLSALLLGLVFTVPAAGVSPDEPFQEIRVSLSPERSLTDLRESPDLEVMGLGDGDVRLLSRPSRTRDLIARGFRVDVLHEDLQSFYSARQKAFGVPGVWHTYDEVVTELARLRADHPGIVSVPFSIGQSQEGRDLWVVRISDNPDSLEDEPEVLFDSVHHAREIMSVELLLAFANYLCDHYPGDPVVRDIVEHRQVYLAPIVNPDGFAYNEVIAPGGGGMWRKNRRPNGGPCFGVDINRNYPFQWGRDDGSSGAPCAEDYRGSVAGSEPETQAMMAFVDAHRFVTHNSFHSVAGMVLLPWCYTEAPAPDDAILRLIVREMARASGYRTGQCPELLYSTSGDFIDWTYGQTTERPAVFSFTTEIGGTGFWPDPSEKDELIQENLPSMLYLAQIAGPAVRADEIVVNDDDGDRRIEPGESCTLAPVLRNEGVLAAARGVVVRLRCDDPYVEMIHASAEIGSIGPGETATLESAPLAFRVEDGCPRGRRSPFTLTITSEGGLRIETPLELGIGESSAIYADDFEIAGSAWDPDPSTTASAGFFERIDPNPSAFQPGGDTTPAPGVSAWVTGQNTSDGDGDVDGGIAAARSPLIDLSHAGGAHLTLNYFHGQRDGGDDPVGDFFRIDVSSDGGDTWGNLVAIGDQATAGSWRTLAIDLGSVIELTDRVCMRIQVADGLTDGDLIEGGIDDVRIVPRDVANQAPPAPAPMTPLDGAADLPARPVLVVENVSDVEGDPLTYGFRVFEDNDPTHVVASADGIPAGGGLTSWEVTSFLDPGTYSWRAFAADPAQRGLFSDMLTFSVGDSSVAPPSAAFLSVGPNPMKGSIRIRYAAPPAATSSLAVYDPQGRFLRDLDVVPSASGWREIEWDGRDATGRPVPNGHYWVRLRTPAETRTVQVVRVR